ncbi:hypothetical protein RJZ57_003269, partial [Blastomyces gilchristii]
SEADEIGLMMMAKSCFKPEAAVGLWSRMHRAEKAVPSQILSTHPSVEPETDGGNSEMAPASKYRV